MDYSLVPNILAFCVLGLRILTISFRDFTTNTTTRLSEILILALTFTFIICFSSLMIIIESARVRTRLMFPAWASARLRLLAQVETRRGSQHGMRSISLMCLIHILFSLIQDLS